MTMLYELFQGKLQDGKEIAVKRLSSRSGQGKEDDNYGAFRSLKEISSELTIRGRYEEDAIDRYTSSAVDRYRRKTTPAATAPMANVYANATVLEKIENLAATFRHRK
ncbi:hypothetical protein YC2023_051387 [Brassica napus]